MWRQTSSSCKDFIRKLLVTDPMMRLSAQQAINHRWLTPKRRRSVCTDQLSDAVQEIHQYQARKRWKKGVSVVRSVIKIRSSIAGSAGSSPPRSPVASPTRGSAESHDPMRDSGVDEEKEFEA